MLLQSTSNNNDCMQTVYGLEVLGEYSYPFQRQIT